jgi:hypothetical protein
MNKIGKFIKAANGNIKNWWYGNDNIFCFNLEISLLCFIFVIKIITIEFSFKIVLPYFFNYFTNLFCKYKVLGKNKVGEIELIFMNNLITGINFYKNIHCHHAQICLEISILGLTMIFKIYDGRHWNEENSKWENYDK